MVKRMLIDARHPEETRVAVVSGNRIEEFDFESAERRQLKGNIYLAKVTRVEPSLQAAFVDYGGNRHGFLAFSEIHPDYYQIPREDRDALLREEAEHHAEEEALRARQEQSFESEEDEDLEAADNGEDEDRSDEDREAPAPAPAGGSDDDQAVDALRQKRMALRRRYKIQDVIRRRQVLLVQVVKEERGNKGAALTTYLSLAGRYCVLMPNTTSGGGISRKISNQADRKRLKSIMADMQLPPSMGCIVRTAGLERTKTEIKRDFDYLTRLWDEIRDLTLQSSAPALIYEDSSLIKRAIRDIYSREVDEVYVQGEDSYRAAKAFMKLLMPSHARKVQLYTDPVPLFQRFGVEAQLAALYQPLVQLKSGGYIVINPTEALVSIDINSGRSTREHSIEQTALNTNLEAAEEIARQLRLRDMAGLVVIDFIDMESNSNVRKVERAMKEALKNDRARIQVGRISSFGLMEMSRQRLRTGMLEASTHTCPMCEGTGLVRTVSSSALSALRGIEDEAGKGRASQFTLRTDSEVAFYILNRKRADIAAIETQYGVTIDVVPDSTLHGPQFTIDAGGPPPDLAALPPRPALAPVEEAEEAIEEEIEEEEEEAPAAREERGAREEEGARKPRRRRRRRPRREEGAAAEREPGAEAAEAEAEAAEREPEEEARAEEGGEVRKRKRRSRRGGRGRRREPGEAGAAPGEAEAAPEAAAEAEAPSEVVPEAVAAEPVAEEKPVTRRRPRARKPSAKAAAEAEAPVAVSAEPEAAVAEAPAEAVPEAAAAPAPKPRRPRKKVAEAVVAEAEPEAAVPEEAAAPAKPARKRRAAAQAIERTARVEAAPAETAEAEAPTPAESVAEEGTQEGASPRRGWWQRTFGA